MNSEVDFDKYIKKFPKVFIIILSWNRMECLKSCIESILRVNYPNYEVVVVDNASTDGSPEMVKHTFESVKLIRNKRNLGYTGGNNVGIKFALMKGADYVLLLNDDVVVDRNFLIELVKVAERDPNIGVVAPKIYYYEEPTKLYQRYGKRNFYLGMPYKRLENVSEPDEVDYILGTALLVKKEVIKRVGMLDQNFFAYVEEHDWCYRIRKAGFKIMYVPTAIVYHKVSLSFSGRVNPVVLYYDTRNELLFARKHLNPLLFFPLWIPRFIFRIIRYAMKTRNIQVVKAIIDGFLDFTKGKYGVHL